MDKFYITMDIGEVKGAFSKARNDIEIILKRKGYIPIIVKNPSILYLNGKSSFVKELIIGIRSWISIMKKLLPDSILFFQHPMPYSLVSYIMIPLVKAVKKVKIICVIHDIYSFRDKKDKHRIYYHIKDIGLLNRCDKVICHNEKMLQKLSENSVKKEKLFSLEIFDYILDDCQLIKCRESTSDDGIIIAGNLSGEKAHYLNLLNDLPNGLKVFLYGPNFNNKLYVSNSNILYKGVFNPEELPKVLNGSYGLVWDGDLLTECSGNIGEYLKINNPHKASLYLASGIPIIVWEKSALADFVKTNGVGIIIDSLYSLKKIEKVTKLDYKKMIQNVNIVGEKIRKGKYFEKAILECETFLGIES